MASYYYFAVIDVMRDDDGQPLTMRDGKPRFCESLTEISAMRSTATEICRTLGLSEDFELLRSCPLDAIQIPTNALEAAMFAYTPMDADENGGASINGEPYGDMIDEDRIESFKTLQGVLKRPTARLFLRMS
jgi:hypothetical protein